MSRVLAFLVAFAASAGAASATLAQVRPPQAPARDTSARPASSTGTGTIRGRVLDADTRRPVARVDIRAISPVLPQPRSVKTDANGRYEVTGLPAGRYVVAASKTNYLTTSFGATRTMGPGKGFDLSDGQVADTVDFALPHAGVIAGRVVDDFGDPLPDVRVFTMRYQYVNGERRMMLAPGGATTDDIGEFRAFGLPPGDYFVASANVIVHDDLTFETQLTAGHFLLWTPNPGATWRLDRVLAGGVDVTDIGIDVAPNGSLPDIVVQMTHHVSELSGRVTDASGSAIRDCYVIVFARDSSRWTVQTRHVAASRPTADEKFRVLVPPGEYPVFATADVEPGEWTDPAYLAQIRDRAIGVSIGADEKKAIEITLAAPAGR